LSGDRFSSSTVSATTHPRIPTKRRCTDYERKGKKFYFSVIERILPRLAHINPTVVFSAVKVILKYLDYLDNGELVKNLCKKLAPSLGIN
jgi:hypothetical protein